MNQQECMSNDDLMREFIRLLDIREESYEGRLWAPNRISSARAMDGERMNRLLTELKNRLFP